MRRRLQFDLKTLFWMSLVVSAFCAGRSIQMGYLRRQLLQSQDKLYYSDRQYERHTKALKARVALLEDRLTDLEAKKK